MEFKKFLRQKSMTLEIVHCETVIVAYVPLDASFQNYGTCLIKML